MLKSPRRTAWLKMECAPFIRAKFYVRNISRLWTSAFTRALALRVPATRLHEIVKERRSLTPDTALRLARYFGTDAQSWLNLQLSYDLKIAEAELTTRIEREVHAMAA